MCEFGLTVESLAEVKAADQWSHLQKKLKGDSNSTNIAYVCVGVLWDRFMIFWAGDYGFIQNCA